MRRLPAELLSKKVSAEQNFGRDPYDPDRRGPGTSRSIGTDRRESRKLEYRERSTPPLVRR